MFVWCRHAVSHLLWTNQCGMLLLHNSWRSLAELYCDNIKLLIFRPVNEQASPTTTSTTTTTINYPLTEPTGTTTTSSSRLWNYNTSVATNTDNTTTTTTSPSCRCDHVTARFNVNEGGDDKSQSSLSTGEIDTIISFYRWNTIITQISSVWTCF